MIGAEPLVRVGIMSDTHVTPKPASCKTLELAMELFKRHQVDAIVHCGDVADVSSAAAYDNYRNTVRKVFPENKPPELFAFAGHDIYGTGNWTTGWVNGWPIFKKGLDVQHEKYSKNYIKGYIFITVQQKHDNMPLYEKLVSEACAETPDKPVFVIDHVPAYDTVYNSRNDGDRDALKLLRRFPQVVQLSGHIHGTFRNEMLLISSSVKGGSFFTSSKVILLIRPIVFFLLPRICRSCRDKPQYFGIPVCANNDYHISF